MLDKGITTDSPTESLATTSDNVVVPAVKVTAPSPSVAPVTAVWSPIIVISKSTVPVLPNALSKLNPIAFTFPGAEPEALFASKADARTVKPVALTTQEYFTALVAVYVKLLYKPPSAPVFLSI